MEMVKNYKKGQRKNFRELKYKQLSQYQTFTAILTWVGFKYDIKFSISANPDIKSSCKHNKIAFVWKCVTRKIMKQSFWNLLREFRVRWHPHVWKFLPANVSSRSNIPVIGHYLMYIHSCVSIRSSPLRWGNHSQSLNLCLSLSPQFLQCILVGN